MKTFTFGIWGQLPPRPRPDCTMWRWDEGQHDFSPLHCEWYVVVEAEDRSAGLKKAMEMYQTGANSGTVTLSKAA